MKHLCKLLTMPIIKSVAERHRYRSHRVAKVDQSTLDERSTGPPLTAPVWCAEPDLAASPGVLSDAGHTEKIAPRVRSMQVACQPSVIISGSDLPADRPTADLESTEGSSSGRADAVPETTEDCFS
jgi:hypothetical protein